MRTMNFYEWLKVNYPDKDKDDFLCARCNGEINYECWECGEMATCNECQYGVDKYLGDEQEIIFEEFKAQKQKDIDRISMALK